MRRFRTIIMLMCVSVFVVYLMLDVRVVFVYAEMYYQCRECGEGPFSTEQAARNCCGGRGGEVPRYKQPLRPSPAELERIRKEEEAELERLRKNEAAAEANRKGNKYSQPRASKEDYDTARGYYKEALRLDPDNSTIYEENIAQTFLFEGFNYMEGCSNYQSDIDMQIKCFEDVLSYAPSHPIAKREIRYAKADKLKEKGNECYRRNDYVMALKYYKQSCEIEPNTGGYSIEHLILKTEAKLEEQRNAHEKTQNMLDDLESEMKKTGEDYYLQEDYRKGLKINDVPLPGKGESFKGNNSAKSEKPGMYKKAITGTKEWIKKKKEEFKLWTMSESFDKAFGWIPWFAKGKDTYEEGKKIHKGISEKLKSLLNKSMEGAREGSKDLATEGGSYNYDGDNTQKEMQDEVEKQKTDALKKRFKFKR